MLVQVPRKCWTQSKFRTGGFRSGAYYWEIINKNKIKIWKGCQILGLYTTFTIVLQFFFWYGSNIYFFPSMLSFSEYRYSIGKRPFSCSSAIGVQVKCLQLSDLSPFFSLLKFKHNLTDLSAIFFFVLFTLFYGPPDPSLIKLLSSRTVLFLWIAISPINLTITQTLLIFWLK